ncbi:MAG: protein kinase domain-containing protein [Chlamydiia bacterium]
MHSIPLQQTQSLSTWSQNPGAQTESPTSDLDFILPKATVNEIFNALIGSRKSQNSEIATAIFEVSSKKSEPKLNRYYIQLKVIANSAENYALPAFRESKDGIRPYILMLPKPMALDSKTRHYEEQRNFLRTVSSGGDISPKIKELAITTAALKEGANIKLSSDQKEALRAPYFVEFIQGGDLRNFLIENPHLTLSDRVGIAQKLCTLVQTLHNKYRIAHRDIKPQNFVIRKIEGTYQVFIIDFGLATQKDNIKSKSGTEMFFPPEYSYVDKQIGHNPFDGDKYSLGSTLFTLLSNKFFAENYKKILEDSTVLEYHLNYLREMTEEGMPGRAKDSLTIKVIKNDLQMHPNRIQKAVFGLMRFEPNDRADIESTIDLLN